MILGYWDINVNLLGMEKYRLEDLEIYQLALENRSLLSKDEYEILLQKLQVLHHKLNIFIKKLKEHSPQ